MPAGPALEVAKFTRSELTSGERLDTSAGRVALALALRIDAGAETGAALAALAREHAAAMNRALGGTGEEDPVSKLQDEVARRRAEHATSG